MGKYDDYIGDSADPGGKTPYDKPGTYWQLISAIKEKPKAKGSPGKHSLAFIIEKVNLRSLTKDSVTPEGTRCSDVYVDSSDYFGKEVQRAIAGIMGETNPSTISGSEIEEAVGEEQPLCGIVVRVEVEDIPTKAGGTFTRTSYHGQISWADVEEGVDPELIEAFFPEGLPAEEEDED